MYVHTYMINMYYFYFYLKLKQEMFAAVKHIQKIRSKKQASKYEFLVLCELLISNNGFDKLKFIFLKIKFLCKSLHSNVFISLAVHSFVWYDRMCLFGERGV